MNFPFGRAPLVLIIIAVICYLFGLFKRISSQEVEADLILASQSAQHIRSFEPIVEKFERENDVKVMVQLLEGQALTSKLQNALIAGARVPDVFELAMGYLPIFTRGPAEDHQLLPIGDFLKEHGYYDRLLPNRLPQWSAHGLLYGIPHDVHPVALAYRKDLIDSLGIDVEELDTWDKFCEVGRRLSVDDDGDGIIDRFMLDMDRSGGYLQLMMLQAGIKYFDEDMKPTFNTPLMRKVMAWYIRQTNGPTRIATEAGWSGDLLRSLQTGLVLFVFCPDWRSQLFIDQMPDLAGKMRLMPMPAWDHNDRRTSTWGGAGILVTKSTKMPELAKKLAAELYFSPEVAKHQWNETKILPADTSAWLDSALYKPEPFFGNQPIGSLYVELAKQVPDDISNSYAKPAIVAVGLAMQLSSKYYEQNGEDGFMEEVEKQLIQAEQSIQQRLDRDRFAGRFDSEEK